ncbi:hypothetical protein ATANTOWER_015078 [Ataeniobius toweri]|uniref:Uncharacterized protein n=1 Tax=Ataeniobius toweri TaxID=208326 RepID=A0ABU7BQG0_9TELE|nr:hypothetical protein [Ataeniobius toweri]
MFWYFTESVSEIFRSPKKLHLKTYFETYLHILSITIRSLRLKAYLDKRFLTCLRQFHSDSPLKKSTKGSADRFCCALLDFLNLTKCVCVCFNPGLLGWLFLVMDHGLLGDRLRHVDGSLLELLLGQVLNLCMMRSLQSQAFTFLTPAGVQVLTFLSTCTRVLAQTTAVQLG